MFAKTYRDRVVSLQSDLKINRIWKCLLVLCTSLGLRWGSHLQGYIGEKPNNQPAGLVFFFQMCKKTPTASKLHLRITTVYSIREHIDESFVLSQTTLQI